MELEEAIELVRPAVADRGDTWADFGAGEGTFTRALAVIAGPQARIFAVDRDLRALQSLRELALGQNEPVAEVIPVHGDFRQLDSIREIVGIRFDGVLFANSLHFAPDADLVLVRAARTVRPGGRVVVVEYDDRPPSPWVPHPVPADRLRVFAARAQLEAPVIVSERPSEFGGAIYCATLVRPEAPGK